MLPAFALALLLVLPGLPAASSAAVARLEPVPLLATGNWTVEPVAFFGGSSEPGIALDSHGTPHVLYCPPGDVRYASRNATGWSNEHIVFTPFGGICGDLAMGPGDMPHVTTPWATAYGGQLYGTRANGTWDLAVYPGGLLGAVNSRGEPQVVTYWSPAPGQFSFRYLTLANGTWVHGDVETFAATGAFGSAWASLTLDAADQPRVLYYDDIRGDVRYAFRNDTGWHVEVVQHTGALNIVGREGSLALDSDGNAHAAYTVRTGSQAAEVRYGVRGASGWTITVASEPAPALGGGGFAPVLGTYGSVVMLTYAFVEQIDPANIVYSEDLRFATLTPSGWGRETVVDGYFDGRTREGIIPQFPSMAIDKCGNPHLAFYRGSNTDSGVYYATKGGPCDTRSVRLNLDPDTLNLKSRGKWVTAYVEVENGSVADIDARSLRLNGVAPAWTRVWDDTLVAKFDRTKFAATVQPGEKVLVALTGHWKDGGTFTATDTIRVISPGR